MILSVLVCAALADEPVAPAVEAAPPVEAVPAAEAAAEPAGPPANAEWSKEVTLRVRELSSSFNDRCVKYFPSGERAKISVQLTIADGRTSDVSMVWHNDLASDELTTCMLDAMSRWKFKKSIQESGVTTFEVGTLPPSPV